MSGDDSTPFQRSRPRRRRPVAETAGSAGYNRGRIAAFVEGNLPYGRFGRLDEVADLVTFLASPRASLMTGACVNVDGGQSRSLI